LLCSTDLQETTLTPYNKQKKVTPGKSSRNSQKIPASKFICLSWMAPQQVVRKNGVRRESVSISVLFLVEMRAKNGERSADEAINTATLGIVTS
jgi:hypothetical protein